MITIKNRRRGETGEYVGRPTVLGNPFMLHSEGEREAVLERYRVYAAKQMGDSSSAFSKEMQRLHSKWVNEGHLELVCWCAPKLCHADVIRSILMEMD